jgi:multiple sugar transport system ATP-binding protein
MSGVSFRAVRKVFPGGAIAVKGLDLDIRDGEFVSLLGPSGCGKTTTLRMLAGLETPTAGRILIGGRDVTDVAPAQRNIAMVFQSYALYPHMTVAQNIEYPLRKRGMAATERAERVGRTAELLQLVPLLQRRPKQLSGGQQQRVALGRAIVREPEVFLLDEPLSNLDAKLRAHMRAELIQLQKRLGKTMIYVTHDQLEAMTMSDRIVIMNQGEVQQVAGPEEIYQRPANRFVAGFVGTPAMNFLRGRVDGGVFTGQGLSLQVPSAADEEVELGLRPEDLLLGEGDLTANVSVVEPTGHEHIVLFRAGNAEFTARVPAERRMKAGESVPLAIRGRNAHVFDAASGQRLA